MIEVTPSKPFPSSIIVQLDDDHVAEGRVKYGWVPDICNVCQSFGHLDASCKVPLEAPPLGKIPLPRPLMRMWVPKSMNSTPPIVAPIMDACSFPSSDADEVVASPITSYVATIIPPCDTMSTPSVEGIVPSPTVTSTTAAVLHPSIASTDGIF